MIPKVIHWCWFGRGKLPAKARACIRSWEKMLPSYEIKVWNEDNFDIASCQYVKEAYEARRFAFVTDYVRLYALYTEGGIYMDSDVEVIRPLDEFISCTAFTGYESKTGCITGIMGSEKHGQWVKDLLDGYIGRAFYNPDGSINEHTNVEYTVELMKSKGADILSGFIKMPGYVMVYPLDYFCPIPWDKSSHGYRITKNTYTIHHFAGSWMSPKERKINWVRRHLGFRASHYFDYFYRSPSEVVQLAIQSLKRRFG